MYRPTYLMYLTVIGSSYRRQTLGCWRSSSISQTTTSAAIDLTATPMTWIPCNDGSKCRLRQTDFNGSGASIRLSISFNWAFALHSIFSYINCPEAEIQLLAGKRSSVYNRNAKRWRYIIRGTPISIDERRRRKNKKIKVSFKKFFLLLWNDHEKSGKVLEHKVDERQTHTHTHTKASFLIFFSLLLVLSHKSLVTLLPATRIKT